MKFTSQTRRRLIAGSAAAIALHPLFSRAQGFPSKNMRVVIPTGQGGGADRLARVFDDFWGPLLETNFEYGFFAGAAGQVGYELYINKRERDGHNLLFGNMGPEMIMYALQKPPYRFPEDYQYFCRLDVDDSVVYVRRQSPFKRLEDLVAEGKKRAVNVAVSRLPHPASIGMLALGNATKARFNLVPYGGGNPTSVAVMNGEADAGALPIAGVVALGDQMRVLGIFNDDAAKMAKYSGNAPAVNKVFGTKIPPLYSSRSWAIHTEVVDKFPDRFALLEKTARQVFDNPKYKEEYAKTGAPVETIQYGDRKLCTEYSRGMIELANEYRTLLTAKKVRKPLGADLVIPALALGFAAYFFVSIADLAWEAKANGLVIGGILVLLIVIQLARIALRVFKGEASLDLRELWEPREVLGKRVGMVFVTIAFIATLSWLGLTLGLLLSLFAALWIMGARGKPLAIIPVAVAAAAYLLFVYLLQSDIPHGPIERLLS